MRKFTRDDLRRKLRPEELQKELTLEDLKNMTINELKESHEYYTDLIWNAQLNGELIPAYYPDNLELITERLNWFHDATVDPLTKFRAACKPTLDRAEPWLKELENGPESELDEL